MASTGIREVLLSTLGFERISWITDLFPPFFLVLASLERTKCSWRERSHCDLRFCRAGTATVDLGVGFLVWSVLFLGKEFRLSLSWSVRVRTMKRVRVRSPLVFEVS